MCDVCPECGMFRRPRLPRTICDSAAQSAAVVRALPFATHPSDEQVAAGAGSPHPGSDSHAHTSATRKKQQAIVRLKQKPATPSYALYDTGVPGAVVVVTGPLPLWLRRCGPTPVRTQTAQSRGAAVAHDEFVELGRGGDDCDGDGGGDGDHGDANDRGDAGNGGDVICADGADGSDTIACGDDDARGDEAADGDGCSGADGVPLPAPSPSPCDAQHTHRAGIPTLTDAGSHAASQSGAQSASATTQSSSARITNNNAPRAPHSLQSANEWLFSKGGVGTVRVAEILRMISCCSHTTSPSRAAASLSCSGVAATLGIVNLGGGSGPAVCSTLRGAASGAACGMVCGGSRGGGAGGSGSSTDGGGAGGGVGGAHSSPQLPPPCSASVMLGRAVRQSLGGMEVKAHTTPHGVSTSTPPPLDSSPAPLASHADTPVRNTQEGTVGGHVQGAHDAPSRSRIISQVIPLVCVSRGNRKAVGDVVQGLKVPLVAGGGVLEAKRQRQFAALAKTFNKLFQPPGGDQLMTSAEKGCAPPAGGDANRAAGRCAVRARARCASMSQADIHAAVGGAAADGSETAVIDIFASRAFAFVGLVLHPVNSS